MTLQETFAQLVDTFRALDPALSVACSFRGVELFAVGDASSIQMTPSAFSDSPVESTSITVKASDLPEPQYGEQITVSGVRYFVASCVTDAVGATRKVGLAPYYSEAATVTDPSGVYSAALFTAHAVSCRILEPTIDDFSQFGSDNSQQETSIVVFRVQDWPFTFAPRDGLLLTFTNRPALYVSSAAKVSGDWRCTCKAQEVG